MTPRPPGKPGPDRSASPASPPSRNGGISMQKLSLEALARQHLARATTSATGRSSQTVHGGHERVLRQTLIALRSGSVLAEHENPGEATVLVLRGRIRLVGEDAAWDGMAGDLIVVPDARHSVEAVEDAALVLTVAKTL